MNEKEKTLTPLTKWGAVASFVMSVGLVLSGWFYLTGKLETPLGPFTYSFADVLYGPVFAVCLITVMYALKERFGEAAPNRSNLALWASIAAECAFILVASIRGANRHYHLTHPELMLQESSTVLVAWTTLVAGAIAAAWHILGWAWILIGSAGWSSKCIPRLLSVLFLGTGIMALLVFLLPDAEGFAILFTVLLGIWLGILFLVQTPKDDHTSVDDSLNKGSI